MWVRRYGVRRRTWREGKKREGGKDEASEPAILKPEVLEEAHCWGLCYRLFGSLGGLIDDWLLKRKPIHRHSGLVWAKNTDQAQPYTSHFQGFGYSANSSRNSWLYSFDCTRPWIGINNIISVGKTQASSSEVSGSSHKQKVLFALSTYVREVPSSNLYRKYMRNR